MNTQRGFTLAEILVALVLFSISMLGISAHILTTIQTSQDTRVQAQASELLIALTEPLNRAVRVNVDQLQQALTELQRNANQIDAIRPRFRYQLLTATDGQQQNLLSTEAAQWVPPYTIDLRIEYQRQTNSWYRIQQSVVLAP